MNKIDGVYRSQTKQWLAALAASLAMVNVGNEEFWLLKTMGNVYKSHLAGFFVAATSSVIGAILGAIFADRFGRKRTILVTSIFVICQIAGGFSTNGVLSCVALFLGEIGIGITRVVVPLYVSEIVDDNIRGALLMLQLPFFYIGKLIAIGIGVLVSTELLSVISLILTGIFLVTFSWFPETPYYLASKKRDRAAAQSLAFYQGTESIAAEEEIEEIFKDVEAKSDSQGRLDKILELVRPTNRKGFALVIYLIILKWSEEIFDSRNHLAHITMGTLVSNENHGLLIAIVTNLITSLLIVFTIDVIGRRSFLSLATFVGFIVIIIALIQRGNQGNHEWVHSAIAIALHFCELIIFSVSLVYVGELFSDNIKALAIAIVTVFNLLISFVIIILPETIQPDVNSFIGGIILLFAFPITFSFFPETKRKSFTDIHSELATRFHCRWLRKKLFNIDES